MSLFLATLNPGRKTRRRRQRRRGPRPDHPKDLTSRCCRYHYPGSVSRRRNPFATTAAMGTAFSAMKNPRRRGRHRRKLTPWQSAVKKYGGVMKAVRAMRGRKHKHRKKRRSTVSRRGLRSRSRRIHGRRPKMARVRRRRHRRHRMPSRGRGGRFVSRHHRRRRHRRNPVVPVSWSGNPGRRRRRRSHRRRRNPLFLSKRGFSRRKHRGYRRLHRRRRHPRYWHNPVLPYFAFNPRRRKHGRRRHHRRSHRRGYRRNPVLPFFAFNPGGAGGDIMARMKSMVDVRFWTETALPVAGGFFGSKLVGSQLYSLISSYTPLTSYIPLPAIPYVRLALNAVSGAGMAWAAERFVSKKAGDGIWIGTIVGVASSLLKNLLDAFAPGVSGSLGLSGLAGLDGDISSQMKDAVVRRVQANLGVYMTQRTLNRGIVRPSLASFQTRNALTNATYDPSPRGVMSDYDVTNTDTTL